MTVNQTDCTLDCIKLRWLQTKAKKRIMSIRTVRGLAPVASIRGIVQILKEDEYIDNLWKYNLRRNEIKT